MASSLYVPPCPYRLCARLVSEERDGTVFMLRAFLAAARADPAFMLEVGSYAGEAWLNHAAEYALRFVLLPFAHPNRMLVGGDTYPEAAVPIMAAVLWFARPPLSSLFVRPATRAPWLELMLRAGRRCLECIEFFGGACVIPPEWHSAFEPMQRCERLHTVRAQNIPEHSPEHLASVLAKFAPPSLVSLELQFLPIVPRRFADRPTDARWRVPLPGSIQSLVLRDARTYFVSGLSDVIACCCPRLTSLHLELMDSEFVEEEGPAGAAAGGEHRPETHPAAAISAMLPALADLRTLTLSDMEVSAAVMRAIAALPQLRTLSLLHVGGADDLDLTSALREFGASASSLSALHMRNSLNRRETELVPMLDGLRNASLSVFSLEFSAPAYLSGCTQSIADALRRCLALNPLIELSLRIPVAHPPAVAALIAAAACARLSLRRLALRFDAMRIDEECGAVLGECALLESLKIKAIYKDDARLRRLLETVAARTPYLERLQTDSIASTPACLDEPGSALAKRFPESAALYARIMAQRRRMVTARAWAVVRTGIERGQEARLRRGREERAASLGAQPCSSRCRGSLLECLPASVLRRMDGFLDAQAVRLWIS